MNDKQYTEQQLQQMANSNDFIIRRTVAFYPGCPENLLQQLAKDSNKFVRIAVARNPASPTPLLRNLAADENNNVRAGVAKNISCPGDLLWALGRDEDKNVRSGVAQNSICPGDLLRKLATDYDSEVCLFAAQNSTAPIEVVISNLTCFGFDLPVRKTLINETFYTHRDKLLSLARSGKLDFNMVCSGGETFNEGLINGGQVEILNLLLAEHLNGKADKLFGDCVILPTMSNRRI